MSIATPGAGWGRARLVAVAACALGLGVFVYLADRPGGSAQLLPVTWHAAQPLGVFGSFGAVLPDFAHAFALSLLTGLLARTRRGAVTACVAWWFVDSLLELGQVPWAAEALGPHLPSPLSNYLVRGTFDPADLGAITLGAALAFVALDAARSQRLHRSRSSAAIIVPVLSIAGLVLVLGSGGGGGAETSSVPAVQAACYGQLSIDEPTYEDAWQTDRATVQLGGSAPTPGGSTRRDCAGFDPGYVITWKNEANGATGSAGAWSRLSGSLLDLCMTRWYTSGISLAPGDNRITVNGGALGGACITVKRIADTTPPTVVSVSPANGAVDVATNTSLSVSFSEDIDSSSVTPSVFVLLDPAGATIAGTLRQDTPTTLRFTPSVPLAPQSSVDQGRYTGRITIGVRDAAGQNPLPADYVWTFRTGPAADTTPPAVAALDPAADSSCASTEAIVQVTFSESVQASTVTPSSFYLEDSQSVRIPASVVPSIVSARLQPASPLAASARYSATATTGIRDMAGNALAADVRWSFSTGTEYGSWTRTALTNAPSPRAWHAAAWTGTEMIVAGGTTFGTDSGGRYQPSADRWAPIAQAPFMMTSVDQVGVWTGSEVIVYGGTVPMLAYDPRANTWRVASNTGAPAGKSGYSVVWTGSELIVWGGAANNGVRLPTGARYNPVTDSWRPVTSNGAPAARERHSAVWVGREMIVWGGVLASGEITSSGARYDPATDTWTSLPLAGAPAGRYGHTAVWAGGAMIVWGSTAGGGRYVPANDAWSPVSTQCAPSVREAQRAVSDGSRMILWGGATPGYTQAYAQGAIYDPVADTWMLITSASGPSPRYGHSLVWTGSEAIVWGGSDGGPLGTGGRYVP